MLLLNLLFMSVMNEYYKLAIRLKINEGLYLISVALLFIYLRSQIIRKIGMYENYFEIILWNLFRRSIILENLT